MRRLAILPALFALITGVAFAERAEAVGVVASWPVGHQPFSVAVDPADGRLYVSNSGTVGPNRTGTVSVVNPTTGAVTSLNTTGVSDTVAIDPGARRLYAANAEGPGLDIFDLDTGSLVTTLAVGGIGVAVDSATHRIYTTRAGSLTVVDGATNAVVGTKATPCCGLWFGVVLDPGLHRVYLSNIDQTRPTLVVVDDRDLSTIAEVVMPQPIRWALAVDPSSHNVYVGGSDPAGPPYPHSSFFVVEPTNLTIAQTVPLTGFPGGIAVAPGTRRIFMTDLSGQRVLELDHMTFAVTQVIALPWGPAVPTMHPDGRLYVPAFQGSGADVLAAVDVGSAGPVVDSVTLDPASPRAGDVLHAIVVAHGSLGQPLDPANLGYEWLRNGALIGAVPPGPYLNLNGFARRGDTITARVTAHEGSQTSAPKSASVTVADTAPTASVTLDATTPATSAILHATAHASDADSDPLTLTLTWKVNGAVHRTASGPGYFSDSFDLGVPGNGDRGDQVSVEAVASDGTLQSSVALASAIVADSPPTVAVTLDNTAPATRDTLTATATGQDPDNDALTYTFTWKVNGLVRKTTAGASTASFDLSLTGNGDRGDIVVVEVVASDGSLQSGIASATATVQNSAPTAVVALSSATPSSRDILTATATGQDADNDALTYAFTWKVNGAIRRTTSGSSATDSLDLGLAGNGDRGDAVLVEMVASDGALQSGVATATATVVNSAPAVSLALNPASPATNAVVTATASASDADQDVLSFSFTWKVNGAVRKTTSGASLSDTFDLSVAGNGNHGDVIDVDVAVSDGLSGSPASASAVVANTAPTATVYLSSSSPGTNDVLYAGVLAQDVDGDALTFTYTWRVNGVAKRTVTTSARFDRFDLSVKGNGDRRDVVTVTVTASDGAATSAVTIASATVR